MLWSLLESCGMSQTVPVTSETTGVPSGRKNDYCGSVRSAAS